MESLTSQTKIRYHLLDELRGFAVVCMVFYHGFYTLFSAFSSEVGGLLLDFFLPAEPFFAAFFIILSGVSSSLTHSNLRRGLKLLCISIALTAVTILLTLFGIYEEIFFGILTLLSLSMLLVAAVEKYIDKINLFFGATICFALFLILYNVPNGYLGFGSFSLALPTSMYASKWLFWLGFPSPQFYSSDYFPIIPWVFMFFCGVFLGRYSQTGKFPSVFKKKCFPPLDFVGKHALIIYILHQPIIFGVIMLIHTISN
ncbi:MAG: heparan-alpha-glucosaminide N-acetyltransferase domain-containing protein [Oscillospiraceae bacterium]|nr:heparan-alpha-glucosaminide N-acetyltransferase domain-containing protein [Oscillospiraceae bacterium]